MDVAINNRFGILLAEKQLKDGGKKIFLKDVVEATGLPYKTIRSWAQNEVTRFDADVVSRLCEYFGVPVGDLLEYVPDKELVK